MPGDQRPMPQPKRTRLFGPGSSFSASPMRRSAVSGLAARRAGRGLEVLDERRREARRSGSGWRSNRIERSSTRRSRSRSAVKSDQSRRCESNETTATRSCSPRPSSISRARRSICRKPVMRERLEVLLEEEDDEAPARRRAARPPAGRRRSTAGSGGVSSATQVTDSSGTSRPSDLQPEVARGEAEDRAAGAVDDARVHHDALDVHAVAEADVWAVPGRRSAAATARAARPQPRRSHAGTSRMYAGSHMASRHAARDVVSGHVGRDAVRARLAAPPPPRCARSRGAGRRSAGTARPPPGPPGAARRPGAPRRRGTSRP